MGYVSFFLLAALILAAALGVVLNTHPIRSALCLAVTLTLLAVMFVFLDAHMVAALQIIVYAGAILVLFLFVIMLLNLEQEPVQKRRRNFVLFSSGAGLLFALALVSTVFSGGATLPGPGLNAAVITGYGTSEILAERLFTHFVLPFEITSVLLLVAVLGAVVLAKRRLH